MSDRLTQVSIALLDDWVAPDVRQAALSQDYVDHLREQPSGWARSCPAAHLTASALVVAPASREVLLVLHRKLGRWLQTGGHIESTDADLGAAALREAYEESGLSVLHLDPVPLALDRHELTCGGRAGTAHLDVQFLIRSTTRSDPVCSAESEQVRWFPAAELPDVDDSVRRLVAAAVARLGWWPTVPSSPS